MNCLGLSIFPLEEIVNRSSMTILFLFIEEENHVEPTNHVEESLGQIPLITSK